MKITKIKDVKTPTRANTTDAGVDFFIPNDYTGKTDLSPGESCFIPSGIKVNVPEHTQLLNEFAQLITNSLDNYSQEQFDIVVNGLENLIKNLNIEN